MNAINNISDHKDRIILHCDCNSFFASVETVLNPEYKNHPMAVCGSQQDRHGIVLAKNELAKKYNIKTAETIFSAKKKCPELIVAQPHHEEYIKFSRAVNDIYARFTDTIESFGIDESWLDVTASTKIFGTGEQIAEKIRLAVKEEIGITVSIGVSFNKVFAKLGSDYKKPDAITVIDRSNYKKIAYPLPASELLFVGKKAGERLESLGIHTIGDLAECDPDLLRIKFGKVGDMYHSYACGNDNSPVSSVNDEVKSVGNGFTFKHDLVTLDDCLAGIDHLCESIGTRLRRRSLKASTVQLTIKNEFLRSIQRQSPLRAPTDSSRQIAECAYAILEREWDGKMPIRMLTVTATGLIESSSAVQLDIFTSNNDYEETSKRDNAVDKIRQKFGNDAIVNASVIKTDIGIYKKNI